MSSIVENKRDKVYMEQRICRCKDGNSKGKRGSIHCDVEVSKYNKKVDKNEEEEEVENNVESY